MPARALCSTCGAKQTNAEDMFFLVKSLPTGRHYHRLCKKCNGGAPRQALEAQGYVNHEHITSAELN